LFWEEAIMVAGHQGTHGRSGGLDTLRGGAVIAILVWHFLNNTSVLRTPTLSFLHDLTSQFFFGVDLFFVLSGFLIGGALMERRARADYFSRYAARRIGRIFPLYFAWLAAFLLMSLLGAERLGGAFPLLLGLDGMPYWGFLTFTQNFHSAALGVWGPTWLAVTWTLAIEVHFYALAAILIYLVPVRWMGLASLAMIILANAFQHYGWAFLNGQAVFVLTPMRLDGPFVGVLCAWLWRYQAIRGPIARHASPLKWAIVAIIAAHYVGSVFGVLRYPSIFTANAILFGLATLCFAVPDTKTVSFPVRFMRWCGVRCYGLYIFHLGILCLVSHVLYGWPPNVFPPGFGWPAVSVGLAITFGLAAVSWRYFEQPIMRWAAALEWRRPAQAGL
jgi:peptidoglycan/LPS O-acetylase OafA/YrhL